MIRELEVRNFRNLRDGVFRLTSPMVIAGPNNSGKTSLLRAISLWAELMNRWVEEADDFSRGEDGNYRLLDTQLARLVAVPLADGGHLWAGKRVEAPVRIAVRTDEWRIVLEIVHHHSEFIGFRPSAEVEKSDLESFEARPLRALYFSAPSGLDLVEPWLNPGAIPGYLAQGRGGSILRNLLHRVSEDEGKWASLSREARQALGLELLPPGADARAVRAWYRETPGGPIYELECAGGGMVQALLILAALLLFEGTVVLIDEPDAHLHPWLAEKIERNLRHFSRERGAQVIAATHSPRLIRSVEPRALSVLVEGRQTVAEAKRVDLAEQAVEQLDPEDIVLAPAAPGILYLEGHSDVAILRAWADRLGHPTLRFFDQPFWKPYAMGRKPSAPQHHRMLRRLFARKIPGVVLRDGDGRSDQEESAKRNGLRRLFWRRYEIENYLLHPRALVRFVMDEERVRSTEAVDADIRDGLLPRVYRSPLEDDEFHRNTKGEVVLEGLLRGMERPPSSNEYWRIAAVMTPDEIHPEVVEKLDAIAEWFGLMDDPPAAEREDRQPGK